MPINSSIIEAQMLEQQIQEAKSEVALTDVSQAIVTGVPAHANCKKIYNAMKGNLETYNEQIKTDAEHITKIAWGFEEIDQQIANEYKGK